MLSNNQSEEWKVPATIRAYSNVKNLGYCCFCPITAVLYNRVKTVYYLPIQADQAGQLLGLSKKQYDLIIDTADGNEVGKCKEFRMKLLQACHLEEEIQNMLGTHRIG